MVNFQMPKNYSGLTSVEQVWNSYDPDHPDRVTVASLYKMATDRGWISPRNASSVASKPAVSASSVLPTGSAAIFELPDGNVRILTAPPAKREYVLADTVTAGTLNVLAGAGGVSKTMLVMMVSAAMATGCSIGDMQIAQGASMLFLGEEDQAEVSRRLSAICAYGGYDQTAVARLVKAFPAAGVDLRLTRHYNGTLNASDLVQNVIQLVQQLRHASGEPVRLIVFDHARLVMDGDPNDAAHVTQLTRVLTHIAQVTGAAVLLLAPKATQTPPLMATSNSPT